MNISDVEAAQEAWEKAVQGMGLQLPAWHSLGPMLAALESFALSHAAGQDGEQCRAAADIPYETVSKVVRALSRLGVACPISKEEQAARSVELVNDLCREVHAYLDELRALSRGVPEGEYPEAAEVCAEAYQVVGCMLMQLDLFDTPEAEKILDNLSQHRMVHRDVLPWTIGPDIAAQRKEGE